MALWGGRFTQAADQRFKQLNDSLRFDYRRRSGISWARWLVEGAGDR